MTRLATTKPSALEPLLRGVDAREAEAPRSETWMRRIAVASRSISGQTPSASKMRRLPFDSAVVRSSKLGCSAVPNGLRFDQRDLERELRQREREARADETAAGDGDVDGRRRQDLIAGALGSHSSASRSRPDPSAAPPVSTSLPSRVTATSSSMRTPMFHQRLATPLRAGGNVDARLDRHHHAGLEHAPLLADLVVADVVHVHAEPVTGAMHEEAAVGAFLDERSAPCP